VRSRHCVLCRHDANAFLFRWLEGSYGRFNQKLSSYKSPSRRIASLPFDWQRNSRGYQRFSSRSQALPDSLVPLSSNAVLLLIVSLRLGPPARRRRDVVSRKTLNFPLVIGIDIDDKKTVWLDIAYVRNSVWFIAAMITSACFRVWKLWNERAQRERASSLFVEWQIFDSLVNWKLSVYFCLNFPQKDKSRIVT